MGIFGRVQPLPDGGERFQCTDGRGAVSWIDVLPDQDTGGFAVIFAGRRHRHTWGTFYQARDFARNVCERTGHVPPRRKEVRDVLLRHWEDERGHEQQR